MDKLNGLQLATAMGDYANSFSRDKGQEFIEGFCRQHNTLQQSSFRIILELIEHMASEDYHTDGRNDASKQIAKELIDGFKRTQYEKDLARGYSPESAKKYSESEFMKPSKFLPFI